MKKEKEMKICLKCGKNIDLNDEKYVLIGTYNNHAGKDSEEYFHFFCWADYFNDCVSKKMKATVSKMQEKAMELFNSPMIRQTLMQVKGSENLLTMLSMPLNEKKVEIVQKVAEKIEEKREKPNDDTRKKRGRPKKAEMQTV